MNLFKTLKKPWACLFFCTFCFAAISEAQSIPEQFSWLLNTWSSQNGERQFVETWKAKDSESMEGWGYYTVNGDTVVREYLQIRRIGEHIGYLASVNQEAPVLFNLKIREGSQLEFLNEEHDFPQSIRYHLREDTSLHIVISGSPDGVYREESFVLTPQN